MNLTAAIVALSASFTTAMGAVIAALVSRTKREQVDSQIRDIVDIAVDRATNDLRAESNRLRAQNAELRGTNRARTAEIQRLRRIIDGGADD